MTEFAFNGSRLEVDVEATRSWYAAHGEMAGGCGCAYCRNFLAALDGVPPELQAFLGRLGLDMAKPIEAAENMREADGRHWYTVWYHLKGRLLEAGGQDIVLWEGCRASFQRVCCVRPASFPTPCFQLDLDLRLPWVLEEPDVSIPDK